MASERRWILSARSGAGRPAERIARRGRCVGLLGNGGDQFPRFGVGRIPEQGLAEGACGPRGKLTRFDGGHALPRGRSLLRVGLAAGIGIGAAPRTLRFARDPPAGLARLRAHGTVPAPKRLDAVSTAISADGDPRASAARAAIAKSGADFALAPGVITRMAASTRKREGAAGIASGQKGLCNGLAADHALRFDPCIDGAPKAQTRVAATKGELQTMLTRSAKRARPFPGTARAVSSANLAADKVVCLKPGQQFDDHGVEFGRGFGACKRPSGGKPRGG